MTSRLALVLGSVLAFVAVALGAFGAHALKGLTQNLALIGTGQALY